jgi:hypothetical protein
METILFYINVEPITPQISLLYISEVVSTHISISISDVSKFRTCNILLM